MKLSKLIKRFITIDIIRNCTLRASVSSDILGIEYIRKIQIGPDSIRGALVYGLFFSMTYSLYLMRVQNYKWNIINKVVVSFSGHLGWLPIYMNHQMLMLVDTITILVTVGKPSPAFTIGRYEVQKSRRASFYTQTIILRQLKWCSLRVFYSIKSTVSRARNHLTQRYKKAYLWANEGAFRMIIYYTRLAILLIETRTAFLFFIGLNPGVLGLGWA